MPILLHSDFIEDYSTDAKESKPSSNTVNYLVNVNGEIMEKDIRQRLALKERLEIFKELKNSEISEFEKEKFNFKPESLRTNVCQQEEIPVKNCLMEIKNIAPEKQFEHLLSCYKHIEKYETCVKRISC